VNRRLILLLLAVLAIKGIFLAFDAEPSFYFGDSGAYLTTAIGKWIPPDRSFVYGLLLRPLAVWPRSLEPAVVMQAALSGVASWLVGVCLARYFAARFTVAASCALVCAIEPLQLMQERYVLTDSMAIFVFALFLWVSFSYMKTSGLSTLALVQIIGVVLVSLRLRFLPIVLAISFLLPLLSRRSISCWRASQRSGVNWMRALRFVVLPLVISVITSQILLHAYQHLYGELLNKPPAYTYREGVLLAADFAPLIQPIDFPIASERQAIFDKLKFALANPDERRAHRWMKGGLCDVINRSTGDKEEEANRLEHDTAIHAIERDPLGVLRLAWFTYAEFFDYSTLKWNLQLEEGRYVDPQPREAQAIKDVFGIDVTKRRFISVTKRWEERSAFWCWLLLILPLLYPLSLAWQWRRVRSPDIITALCGLMLLADAVVPVEYPNPRYLTPLAWLAFLMIGSLVTRGIRGMPFPWAHKRVATGSRKRNVSVEDAADIRRGRTHKSLSPAHAQSPVRSTHYNTEYLGALGICTGYAGISSFPA